MAFDSHFAPFLPEFAFSVDQEGTANNAHEFAAVHVFLLNYVKLLAQCLIRIGQQVKWEILFRLEIFVRLQAVTRYAENFRIVLTELLIAVTKILPFQGATGCAVFGVEIEQEVRAFEILEGQFLVAGSG